jgi:endonuclease III
MLSSQTKDEVTARATNNLQKLPLDVDTILATDEEKISQLIYPVSFYKVLSLYF